MYRLTIPAEQPDPQAPPLPRPARGVPVAGFAAAAQQVLSSWSAAASPAQAEADHARAMIDHVVQLVAAGRVGSGSGLVAAVIAGHRAAAPGERDSVLIQLTETEQ